MRSHTIRLRVRYHELDPLGHVNNAVYLHYVEEVAVRHAESLGLGLATATALGGAWVVRRHTITYYRPATAGDEIDVATTVESMTRVRANRRTTLTHATTGAQLAECLTEWVWIDQQGRPTTVPAAMREPFESEG